jgi:hypothetical protein
MKFKHGKPIQYYLPNFFGFSQIDFFQGTESPDYRCQIKDQTIYTALACIIPNAHKIILICFVLIILTFIFSTFLKN